MGSNNPTKATTAASGEAGAKRAGRRESYDAASIKVLEGLDAVRMRPAMYIGDVTTRGLHHLVFEIVDNAIDEAMAGFCHNIHVRLRADGAASVEDDGRGIPVDIHPTEKVPTVEVVLCKLHAGGKFDHESYKVSGGLHGVGASVVNALSEWLEIEVYRDEKVHHQTFKRGAKASELTIMGRTTKRGTKVTFKPDPQIFQETVFSEETIAKRLRELAYLLGSRDLTIVIADERSGRSETFRFEKGLMTFVENLNQNKTPIHPTVIHMQKEVDKVVVEVAMQYNDGYHEDVYCFANNINTHEGGTHLSGFRSALTRTLNAYARKESLVKEGEAPPVGEDFREGLAAVVSVLVPDPLFESQTKVKLGNAEVEGAVQQVVNEQLGAFLEEHPGEAKSIVNKALLAMRAREAARKQRDLVRKSAMGGGGLPGKLADCQTRKADEAEIFLVEGDSAGGSAKQARDRRTQAILPLRGKILNVEKARIDRMLGHEEIRTIITALGTGIGADDFDLAKLRYGKVIVMSVDALEHVVVRDVRGVRMTRIGEFVDAALAERCERSGGVERRAGEGLGEVLCFGRGHREVRFRPIRAVIRHSLEEKLYQVRTAYGRSVRVTASHSVFVHEGGEVRLKFGAELKPGDRIVAPRRIRLPETAPARIDLLRTLHSVPAAARQLWLRGPAVDAWHRARSEPTQHACGAAAVAIAPTLGRARRAVRLSHLAGRDLDGFADRDDLVVAGGPEGSTTLGRVLDAAPKLMSELGFHLAGGSRSGTDGGQHSMQPIPDLVFNVSAPLRAAFLRGYFLGDGTASNGRISFGTSSREIASALAYLLASFGVVAWSHEREPDGVERDVRGSVCRTTHRRWTLTVAAADDLVRLRAVWCDHPGAASVEARLAQGRRGARRRFEGIGGDLMAIPVESIAEVAPSNGHVYDFSVEGDENFVAGMGGLCCHNTDADVDGSHIRTLLLTFFYRQMRELVEAGKVYVAAPPLYRVKRGRFEQYIHNEEDLLRIKRDFGLKHTELAIVARGEKLTGDALKPLLEQLANLERAVASLERRGASLRELAQAARGAPPVLPQYRVLLKGVEARYLADEAELNRFLDAERAKKADLSVSYEGDEAADLRVLTFHDKGEIEQALAALAVHGLTLDQVLGPKQAAKPAPFKLRLDHGAAAGEVELQSLREVADAVRKEGERDLEIQRYKGLGEMNPEQLWESTMDPARRTLYQVRTEDAVRADEIFTVLMGEEVEPRRAFIERHALEVRNLDV
jgi:DNA gyrase subunit B